MLKRYREEIMSERGATSGSETDRSLKISEDRGDRPDAKKIAGASNLSTIALKEPMIHEWPEATSNPVGNQESWRRRSESDCADRFINAYWKQVGR
ncbi:hypothetical protein G5I_09205 [Acromyrmex echinatior]|uniref:Uncharacterized protein n=1 Tax=Acromyrmex echinatior TaxID=103372 RepID=F4WTQ6_ACREC|nr:hypothetical protein G5I_09205 [Acromyrmex echinatior]